MSTTALVRSTSSTSNLTRATSNTGSSLVQSPTQRDRPSASSAVGFPQSTQTPQSHTRYSTPATKTSTPTPPPLQPSPTASTPGRWQHPRMEEIIARQNRTNFDNTNMRTVLWNVTFLLLSLFAPSTLRAWLPHNLLQSLSPYPIYTLVALQAFSLFNIGMATTPLFRQQDACEDIPLTLRNGNCSAYRPQADPRRRKEKEQWITPPRYSRSASATPRSSSSSLRAEVSGSPIPPPSTAGGMSFGSGNRRHSGSPLTPGGVDERRRLSLNRNSPLSISEFDAAGSVSTPTKVNQRASVGLNSKWLYEKGRASPTGSRLSGSGWGTGSVFS